MTNLIQFKMENLSKAAQSHILFVTGPRGPAEFLFSYGEVVGIYYSNVCNHLTGIRRTSQMHINLWVKDRASAERGVGDLQSWMNTYFGLTGELATKEPTPAVSEEPSQRE